MKTLSLRDILLAFTLMGLTILVLLWPKMSLATETDSYTYSCIKIEDSSYKINYKLNEMIEEVVTEVNGELKKFPNRPTSWQFYFSYRYYKKLFVDDLGYDAFSPFENCINTNTCEGWPYFERIYVDPKESVYAKANYSLITKNHVAANVEACGVRFGVDKLTHFLKDGFRLYYAKREKNYSDLNLARISQLSEESFFGKTSTGVYSYADMQANMSGLKFFEDLYSKHLIKKDGQIQFSKINICNYINKNFDERVVKNEYSESKKKIQALMKAIEESQNSCTEANRKEILARRPQPSSVTFGEEWAAGLSNLTLKNILNIDLWEVKRVLIDPLFESQEKRDRYPVY